jgi:transcriptional/translational regulatory protein YebC/TACO1
MTDNKVRTVAMVRHARFKIQRQHGHQKEGMMAFQFKHARQ